ncbi:helix-turn-helix transcriptional regulator [Sulfuricella sp.]|uniref:helix-turn-helix transcriptional regulator n=1 Tax=Sulfuricella sp. TaxID=2099377 RepID=UPI002B8B6C8F|nr:WYL domain-containing protein [Sulfuricella sp.]HUX62746.1 WYL domain-containing protein [Sulfuricella sp.]
MSKLDDLYRLHRLLDGRRTAISRQALLDELEISRSKLTRLIADLRDRVGAPLVFDQERGGYRFNTADGRHHLPGLWFTGEELHALVSLDHLLQTLQPGLLDQLLAPIRARLERILQTEHLGGGEAQKRIRILAMAARAKNMRQFQTAAGAVLQRKRLSIEYYNRERDQTGAREISPQRLTHYRDNWYLDAWCHQNKALRIFAVECIRHATVSTKKARNVPDATLDRELTSAYGIFAGEPVATAVLRFTAYRARWVADEIWHPEQRSRWLDDGRYELTIPYSRDTELIMDILKHGAEVEVIAPEALTQAVKKQLDRARSQYG